MSYLSSFLVYWHINVIVVMNGYCHLTDAAGSVFLLVRKESNF